MKTGERIVGLGSPVKLLFEIRLPLSQKIMSIHASIEKQIQSWRSKLLDLSKRNPLLNCKTGDRGAIEVQHPESGVFWNELLIEEKDQILIWRSILLDNKEETEIEDVPPDGLSEPDADRVEKNNKDEFSKCLKSKRLKKNHLLTLLPDAKLRNRLKNIGRAAKESLSEQGTHSLYATFGMLRWAANKASDLFYDAPLFLVPITIDRNTLNDPWTLSLAENDPVLNLSLLEFLKNDFDLTLPEVIPSELETIDQWTEYLEKIGSILKNNSNEHIRRWEIQNRSTFGTFRFQKLAMWHDLEKNKNLIGQHRLCRAIAGEQSEKFEYPDIPRPESFDEQIHPKTVFTILDCDSSQHEAVLAAKQGSDLVLDGPPGTGKSQTIANIIAEVVAEGKTVLFVSEKAAALQVVKDRLEKKNLGEFCLDCHNVKRNKKAFIEEIAKCLDLQQERYDDRSREFERLYKVRKELNDYVDALHRTHGRMNWTAFRCHARLAALKEAPIMHFPMPSPLDVSPSRYDEWIDVLLKIKPLQDTIERREKHPWRHCTETEFTPLLPEQVREDMKQVRDSIKNVLPAFDSLIELKIIKNIRGRAYCQRIIDFVRKILDCPTLSVNWFKRPDELVQKIDNLETQYDIFLSYRKEYPIDREAQILATDVPTSKESLEFIRQTMRKSTDSPDSLGGLTNHLNELDAQRSRLEDNLDFLKTTFSDLENSYGLSLNEMTDLTVLVPAFETLGKYLAKDDMPSASWIDDSQRKVLLEIIRRYAEKEKKHREEYKMIAQRINADAVDSEATGEIVGQIPEFRSFWNRMPWNGNWRRFHKKALSLFCENRRPRFSWNLMDELENLADFLKEKDDIRNGIGAFQDDIPKNSDGEFDWPLLSDQLRRLDKVFQIFPASDSFRESLFKRNPAQGKALQRECEVCRDRISACLEMYEKLKTHWNRFKISDANPLQTGHSLSYLTEALSRIKFLADDLRARIEPLKKLTDFEQDRVVSGDSFKFLQKRLDFIGNLKNCVDGISGTWNDVQNMLGNVTASSNSFFDLLDVHDRKALPFTQTEWETLKRQAAGFNKILKTFGREKLPALIPLVTCSDKKRILEQALECFNSFLSNEVESRWDNVLSIFDEEVRLYDRPANEIADWAENLLAHLSLFPDWVRLNNLSEKLQTFGFDSILQKVFNRTVPVEHLADAFERCFLTAYLEKIWEQDSRLSRFNSTDYEKLIEEFRTLDQDSIRFSPGRIRMRLLGDPNRPHSGTATVAKNSELGTINREKEKKRRHLSIRQIFEKCPTIMLKIKPCLMMSPLAVSTMLDSKYYQFDLVIFDEASQVFPYDAIGAIYRGKHLIVAGDQKQLPPSNYFNRTSDDDDENEESDEMKIGDYGSILDVAHMIGLPAIRLKWHYRSRREPLIAFSNHYFYDDELITFPSVHDTENQRAVQFHHVADGIWTNLGKSGSGSSCNPVEARKTAELVIKHFQNHPERSLGIITCNIRQQSEVETAVEKLRRKHPELEPFFSEDRPEPYFVKNLETVQGDERDVIIFGVGYGRDEHGTIRMNFGPLNKQGGERRLNVAVTRARYHVHLVSSIRSDAIDLNRVKSIGPQRLKEYLEYAETGTKSLKSVTTDAEDLTESDFETQVMKELISQGLHVRSQVGCSGFRIDLALVDPEQPDRFVIGIECDGETYHRSATARDRDRLRQDVLEGLGWRIIRIWSTDWMMDSQKQVRRIVDFYKRRLEKIKTGTISHSSVLSVEQEKPTIVERPEPTQYIYDKIENVPQKIILQCIKEQYERHGKMPRKDMLDLVARQLGFKRTGHKIQLRVGRQVTQLAHNKEIEILE